MKRIDTFKPLFDKAVQEQVEKRLAGKAPERGNSSQTNDKDTLRENIRSLLKGGN